MALTNHPHWVPNRESYNAFGTIAHPLLKAGSALFTADGKWAFGIHERHNVPMLMYYPWDRTYTVWSTIVGEGDQWRGEGKALSLNPENGGVYWVTDMNASDGSGLLKKQLKDLGPNEGDPRRRRLHKESMFFRMEPNGQMVIGDKHGLVWETTVPSTPTPT